MANLKKRSQRDYQDRGRGVSKQCLIGRHKPAAYWELRPALIGAGIVIDQVHFDRPCLRCSTMADRIWSPLVSPNALVAQPEALPLQAWLGRQSDVRILEVPEGEVRHPNPGPIVDGVFTP